MIKKERVKKRLPPYQLIGCSTLFRIARAGTDFRVYRKRAKGL